MATKSSDSSALTNSNVSNPTNTSGTSRSSSLSSSNQTLIEEVTFTLGELNKALDNVQYMAVLAKDLDLASLLKKASKSKWKELLKNIDLKQVQSFLESPLVQQIIADPELLNLFLPQANPGQTAAIAPFPNQSESSSVNNQTASAEPQPSIPSNHYTQPSQQVSLTRPSVSYPTRYLTRQPTRVLHQQRPHRSTSSPSSSSQRNHNRKPFA